MEGNAKNQGSVLLVLRMRQQLSGTSEPYIKYIGKENDNMKFGPIETVDKLGRSIVLRSAEVSDAQDLIRYMKITACETPFLMREPDEIHLTLEQEQGFIKSHIDNPHTMMRTVLSVAKQIGYEQAELEVNSNNISAIALYHKMGFKKYGRIPNSVKYADGSYADTDWMMKRL